jgi:hypothetical protein
VARLHNTFSCSCEHHVLELARRVRTRPGRKVPPRQANFPGPKGARPCQEVHPSIMEMIFLTRWDDHKVLVFSCSPLPKECAHEEDECLGCFSSALPV